MKFLLRENSARLQWRGTGSRAPATGLRAARQTGSHIQLATKRGGEHHVSVPNHRPLKAGLLHGVLKDVPGHHGMTVEELVRELEI